MVAARLEVKQKSGSEKNGAKPPAVSDEPRSSRDPYDPYKITFELLAKANFPEDLAEFKRRIALFRQFVREEMFKQKLDP